MTASRPLRLWASVFAIAALPPLLALWTDRPAPPLPVDAPATEFSEARAMPIVEELAGNIGHRLAGTEGARRGEEYLLERLEQIPGLEIEVQDHTGMRGSVQYRVRNVLARLPGVEPSAVLISSHYDSAIGSVGAADDALGVAAAVEVVRALGAGPQLRHSVVVNLNEGEELGLYGSEAFLAHRWAKDVRAFVNLEAAGAGGRPILFQAGSTALLGAYARGAPHPHGTVFAQDVFDSGIIPSDTDYRIYRGTGALPGLDLTLYQDGWAYHTHLDRPERIERGSLQEMGANTLGFVREAASTEWPTDIASERSVFYDLLGVVMVRYSSRTAAGLALLALVLTAFALRAGVGHRRLMARTILVGGLMNALVFLAAVGLPVAIAWLTAGILDRPFGWYTRPWLAVVAFGAPAIGVVFATHGVIAAPWVARAGEGGIALGDSARAMLLASQPVAACLALAALTFGGLGSAYVALWWALPGALALRLSVTRPDRPLLALAIGYLPGALVTSQLTVALVTNFVPMAGRMSVGFPMDYVIAGIVAVPTTLCALAAAPTLHQVASRFWRPAAAVFLALGVAATGYLAVASPYSPERPRRVRVSLDEKRLLAVRSLDRLPLGSMPTVTGADPDATSFGIESELPPPPPPEIELVRRDDGPEGTSRLTLRLVPRGAYRVRVALGEAKAWTASFVSPPPEGLEFTLSGPSDGPVDVTLQATYASLPPEVDAFLRGWPNHMAIEARAVIRSQVTLSPR